MATKKKPSNKKQDPTTEKKVIAKAKIEWSDKPLMVEIEFNGKLVKTHKSNAKLLVEAGKAKLK